MKGRKKNLLIIFSTIFVLLIALTVWVINDNKAIDVNSFTIKSNKLPENFDGYRIAQISDLHNASFGEENKIIIDLLKEAKPDIVVITGDMLDSRRPGYENSLKFAEKCAELFPCYFVTGNHEKQGKGYPELKNKMTQSGVVVIEDECIELERNEEKINLFGINDPLFKTSRFSGNAATVTKKRLNSFVVKPNEYNILLSHRPEFFELYAEYNIDLVLSGHAHGGQFRVPFIGGLYSPNQGLFPQYTTGIYTKDSTYMIVSRGIGPSIIPFRINNRPEIIIAELKKDS